MFDDTDDDPDSVIPDESRLCLIKTCPRSRASQMYAPMCTEHMIDAWRWVESQADIRPPLTVEAPSHPRNISVPEREHVVYYVRLPSGDVKIGVTYQLEHRMHDMRLPYPESVLAWEPGGYVLERDRHEQFAAERRPRIRSQGRQIEDFAPSERLMAHIAEVRRQHGDPPPIKVRTRRKGRRT